jgi:hypothetical protein
MDTQVLIYAAFVRWLFSQTVLDCVFMGDNKTTVSSLIKVKTTMKNSSDSS